MAYIRLPARAQKRFIRAPGPRALGELSPIVLKQRALYPQGAFPVLMRGFGRFGAANTSVYSGPPVGMGAKGGAATGAAQGASAGAVAGPIGAGIGAVVGAIGGAIAGSIGKKDPEQYSFDAAVSAWQQNPNSIYAIGNKYLPLAGLFDLNLKGPHIPIYQKYGHMGEERFTTDLANLIYDAAQKGKITAQDNPMTIMVSVVQPWIDGWGFGPMQDPHQDLINKLIIGMIADYISGAAPQVWRARGGDLPASFSRIPPFSLPIAAQPAQPLPVAPPPPLPVTAPPSLPVTAPGPVSPPQTAPIPATILTADGSTTTPGSQTAIQNPQGQVFYFGTASQPPQGFFIYLNGSLQGGMAQAMGLLNGGQVYAQNGLGQWYQWTGAAWTSIPGPPVAQPVAAPAPVGAVPIAPSPQAPLLPPPSPLPLPSPVDMSGPVAPPISAPAMPQVQAAGVSGLPPWLTWGAVAGVAYLMLATARTPPRSRKARPHV